MKISKFIFFVFLIWYLSGCSDSREQPDKPMKANSPPGGFTSAEISVMNISALDSLIRHRKGKPLLINIWATWCEPCREEFPDLIQLRKAIPRDALEMIAISTDYPDEVEEKVLPFVQQLGINFPVWVKAEGDDEAFINRLNPDWSGALPATFIYDSRGNQQKFLLGKQTLEIFREEVQKVISGVDG